MTASAADQRWSFGDRVIHTGKPEWGVGMVTKAISETHEGEPSQRLTVRFDRAGMKTLSTAFARLRAASERAIPAEACGGVGSAAPGEPGEMLGPEPMEAGSLARLPEEATDPFASPVDRLKGTLRLYRFRQDGGSLLDWAAAQTGLADPLTQFSRHELEEQFQRFARLRDEHLRGLAMDLLKSDPHGLASVVREAPEDARRVLRRLNGRR